MRESCTCGSLRGAAGNRCPYRDTWEVDTALIRHCELRRVGRATCLTAATASGFVTTGEGNAGARKKGETESGRRARNADKP